MTIPTTVIDPVAQGGVNSAGELICPHCAAAIATPAIYQVQEGTGPCPKCGKVFEVTSIAAGTANDLAQGGDA